MIPKKHLTKDTWYFGVHPQFQVAKWTGCSFVSIVGDKAHYCNHKEEWDEGFEPLIEVEKMGSGRVWSLRDFNQSIYKCNH